MHATIHHEISIRGLGETSPARLVLRLRPRVDGSQTVGSCTLLAAPEPAASRLGPDAADTVADRLWFAESIDAAAISMTTEVETRPHPDDPETRTSMRLPLKLPSLLTRTLSHSLYRETVMSNTPIDPIARIAADLAQNANRRAIPFLKLLAAKLHAEMDLLADPFGPLKDPISTFDKKTGSARDVAGLFIDACRSQELPARYVSGHVLESGQSAAMHVWAEVFTPDRGWQGVDPCRGELTGEHHVAVAASSEPELVQPVTTFPDSAPAPSLQAAHTITVRTG
jgi:transglutaminase-like putative cysteine protease